MITWYYHGKLISVTQYISKYHSITILYHGTFQNTMVILKMNCLVNANQLNIMELSQHMSKNMVLSWYFK